MKYELKNENLKIVVSNHGAELCHLVDLKTNAEYIWSGEAYWKRHSPVLFPFIGSVADGKYSIGGVAFPMTQHGFARDMDFTHEESDDGLWFRLNYSEETMKKYPFRFHLRVGYILHGRELNVIWEATTDDAFMPFMIGAHPAFNCPPIMPDQNGSLMAEPCRRTGCSVDFHTSQNPEYYLLNGSLVSKEKHTLNLRNGCMLLDEHSFDHDAMIFEGGQCHMLSLKNQQGEKFLTIKFDAPLFGIWSPAGDVPFVCLEPWYGRADAVGFHGDLADREYEQIIKRGELYKRSYTIEI